MKAKDYIALMIVPSGGKRSINLKIPNWVFYSFISMIILVFVFLGSTFYLTTQYSSDLHSYNKLKEKHIEAEEKNKEITTQLDALKEDINQLIEREVEIQTVLGSTKSRRWKQNLYRKAKRRQASIKKQYKNIMAAEMNIHDKQSDAIIFLNKHIQILTNSIERLGRNAEKIRDRFASTPSIWPVYGRIKSGYGWRTHPVTGKRRMHKGIDIPSWRGAPIKSTADGVVSYAGWSGTFGNVVVIKHRYGFRTIYAHCTQLLVSKGAVVKKGDVIAQVGSTGLSTGSHVHYEVMRWNRSVSPKPYLDVDMFTASTKLW